MAARLNDAKHRTHGTADRLVYVVDGDMRERGAVAALLARVGFEAQTFQQAEDVLAMLNVQPPACVISELALPGDMDGLALTRTLREREVAAPVIILTRRGDVASAVLAMRSRVADYLTKPYVERDLVERVRAALSRAAAR